jgi:hypothetical protein
VHLFFSLKYSIENALILQAGKDFVATDRASQVDLAPTAAKCAARRNGAETVASAIRRTEPACADQVTKPLLIAMIYVLRALSASTA